MYIHELGKWPAFYWSNDNLTTKLANVRYRQGKILGQMNAMGFELKEQTILQTLTLDVLKSSEIEGELLNPDLVRSSIAKRLGIEIGGLATTDRNVDGVVEMMLDATQHYDTPLNTDRLFGWHSAMFPGGRSGFYKIAVGKYRTGPVQVVSGAMGKERIHFDGPAAEKVPQEINKFLNWINSQQDTDPVIKAGIAHLWFVTIHPFDDGNGRITRAITDMQLARADQTSQRFYSMSAQILKERNQYYHMLEQTQRGNMDLTAWLDWFLDCLNRAMDSTYLVLDQIALRTRFWNAHAKTNFNARQLKVVTLLLDDFYGKLNVSKWAKIANCSTDTALRDIQDLIVKQVLVQEQAGGRNTSYSLKQI